MEEEDMEEERQDSMLVHFSPSSFQGSYYIYIYRTFLSRTCSGDHLDPPHVAMQQAHCIATASNFDEAIRPGSVR